MPHPAHPPGRPANRRLSATRRSAAGGRRSARCGRARQSGQRGHPDVVAEAARRVAANRGVDRGRSDGSGGRGCSPRDPTARPARACPPATVAATTVRAARRPPGSASRMQAGTPTPSKAAPAIASPGTLRHRRPDRRHPRRVPDQVLRQPAAPAHERGSAAAPAAASPSRSATSATTAAVRSSSSRWSSASSRNRPTEARTSSASPGQVRPLRRRDGHALDQPAGHRRDQQARAGVDLLRRERHRDHGHRRVRDALQRLDRGRRDARPAAGPPWAPGAVDEDGVRGQQSPAPRRGRWTARSRRASGAGRAPACAAGPRRRTAATSAAGSDADAVARRSTNTGPSASPRLRAPASRAAAAAASTEPARRQLRGQRRHGRGQATARRPGRRRRRRAAARPAGRRPRRRAARAAAGRPRRRRPAAPAAARPPPATRATPSGERTPASPSAEAGTPSTVPAGSGCRPSGRTTEACVVAGRDQPLGQARAPRPAATASGTRASTASGPVSYQCPASSTRCSLPPIRSAGLEDDDLVVGPAAPPLERGRQPGDPGADDDEPAAVIGRISSCTRSTTWVSTPGSVSGSTPWPRLKTCPRAARPCSHHPAHLAVDGRPVGQQDGGVEVALQRAAGADPAGGLVQRHPPVDADDVGAGVADQRQQLTGADPEVDPRHVRPARRPARRTPRASAAAPAAA